MDLLYAAFVSLEIFQSIKTGDEGHYKCSSDVYIDTNEEHCPSLPNKP